MTWRLLPGAGPADSRRARVVAAVHGMGDNWTTWQKLAAQLGPDYRCYAVDAPWSGAGGGWPLAEGLARSLGDDADHPDIGANELGQPADWLRQALPTVPEPVDVLLGHSFGANAVLDHLAAGQPPMVRAAVLLAPLVRPATLAPHTELIASTRSAIRQVVEEGLRARLGSRFVDDEVIASIVDKVCQAVPYEAAHLVLERLLATPRTQLRQVATPTLVLSGTSDQRFGGAPAALTVMPAAEVRTYQHYHHFCHIIQAVEVAAECVAFLDRVAPVVPSAVETTEVSE